MRAVEFVVESANLDPSFVEAVSDWQEMWNPDAAAKVILASKEARPFTKAPAIKYILRAVRSYRPAAGPVVAYSTSRKGAENFVYSLEVPGKWVVVRKDFSAADFLLDFTAMIQHYGLVGDRDLTEHEIWMRNTPYYATPDPEEVVGNFRT